MREKPLRLTAATIALSLAAAGAAATAAWAGFSGAGPGGGLTGNDTGGIIWYSPDIEDVYMQMAQKHCARWHRLAHITTTHRVYGDYISFVCIDKPGVIE